jgi:hypothetical protein
MRPTIVDAIKSVDQLLSGSKGRKEREDADRQFFCPRNPRNRELIDSELPHADTVRRACSFFETKSRENLNARDSPSDNWRRRRQDSDDDDSDFEEQDDDYYGESDEDLKMTSPTPPKLIPHSVMDRIRSHGSSVTYFGGKIVASNNKPLSPARKVLREILQSSPLEPFQQRWSVSCALLNRSRLVKSNSCDSRLEILVLEPVDEDAGQL